MDAQLDAALQRRGGADVLATAVVPPNQASADEDTEKEKAVAENKQYSSYCPYCPELK